MTKKDRINAVIDREVEKYKVENGLMEKPKKRGAGTPSLEKNGSAHADEIRQMMSNVLQWYGRKCVKTDEECADRLDEYFARIVQTGEIPTWEKLCLALGTDRMTVWQWENGQGCSKERTYMIKTAKTIMASMDAEMVSAWKIPQATYIFRSKNFYGMRDQTDVVVTPTDPLGDSVSQKELEAKYADYVRVVEPDRIEAKLHEVRDGVGADGVVGADDVIGVVDTDSPE